MQTQTINGQTYRVVDIGYRPREQFFPFHQRKQRWACLVAHRRAGKTVACVMDMLARASAFRHQDGRFAYVAPYYVQAKDAAWTYLKRFSMPIEGVEINESELRIDLPHNGARIRVYGADNYDRMRGGYFDGVILDEYGDMHPAAYPEVIRPMLADRKGWAVFIGTPKGRNDFFQVWERAKADPRAWFEMVLRASDSGLIDEDEIEAIRAELTSEQFEQEMECSFDAAVLGAYFGKELVEAESAGRIGSVQIDPTLPVHTSWDLGIGDSTAIWCWQIAPDNIRVVDYYESHSQPLGHYVGVLNSRGYKGKVWVPHDAKARELGTGRTRVETLQGLGCDVMLVPNHQVLDGINAARVSFSRFWFDETNCRQGIEALRQYRAEYDEKLKVFKNNPRHDWTSHAADAFRYLAMAWKTMAPPKPKPKPTHLVIEADATGIIHANMSVRDIVEARRKRRMARLNG
jgi:phage terminase large subunit